MTGEQPVRFNLEAHTFEQLTAFAAEHRTSPHLLARRIVNDFLREKSGARAPHQTCQHTLGELYNAYGSTLQGLDLELQCVASYLRQLRPELTDAGKRLAEFLGRPSPTQSERPDPVSAFRQPYVREYDPVIEAKLGAISLGELFDTWKGRLREMVSALGMLSQRDLPKLTKQVGLLTEAAREVRQGLPPDPRTIRVPDHVALHHLPTPSFTSTRGWTDAQVRSRLDIVKKSIGYDSAFAHLCVWWDEFERDNARHPSLVLRVAEEIAWRGATIANFVNARSYAYGCSVEANLHFLDAVMAMLRDSDREKKGASGR